MKKRVTVIVERGKDGYYSCFVEDKLPGCGLMGYGNTVNEAKSDLQVGYYETNGFKAENGEELLPELTYVYKYDMQPFFEQFPWINVTKVAEIAGINPSLMRQYAAGITMVGQKQYDKIRRALHKLSVEFAEATM